MVKVKKPLVIRAILVSGLILFGLNDSDISIADTSNSNKEVTGTSSAGATITITMTGVVDE